MADKTESPRNITRWLRFAAGVVGAVILIFLADGCERVLEAADFAH
jgi:hypothetical protein